MIISHLEKCSLSTEIRVLLDDEIDRLKWELKHVHLTDYCLKKALFHKQILKFMRENPELFTEIDNKFNKECK